MMGSFRAIALALWLAPALAVAQPSAKDKQQASDMVKRAIAKSQAGDHDQAVVLYLDAYKLIPNALLLSNIGSEYQQMRKPVEALKYFCKYLEADPTGNNVVYATAQARALYIELGGITTVEDGDVCKPIVKPAPPPPPTPVTPPEPTPTPVAPTPTPVDNPGPKASPLRYVGLGVGVVGLAVFGGGVYYGLEAKRINDEIEGWDINTPWPSDIREREQKGADAEKKQIGMMIGGGVALAAGVVLFFVGAPKASAETSVSVVPVATGDQLGFAAAGRF